MKRKQQFFPGVLVVLAGTHVEPLISKKLGVPISYYTFSVHGLPALLGGLVAILMASLAEEKQGIISVLSTCYSGTDLNESQEVVELLRSDSTIILNL